MRAAVAYVDSSAFVKLVVAEPESRALREALARWRGYASATLLRTEVVRSLRRSGHDQHLPAARRLMRAMHMIGIDEPLLDRAADLDPTSLRSLDAVHLAAALALGSDLGTMFVYDASLKAAAEAHGLDTVSPR